MALHYFVQSSLPVVPWCPAFLPCCCCLSDLPLTLWPVTGSLSQFLIHLLRSLTPWSSLAFYFLLDSLSSEVCPSQQTSLWNGWAQGSLLLPLPWGQWLCELFQPCIKMLTHRNSQGFGFAMLESLLEIGQGLLNHVNSLASSTSHVHWKMWVFQYFRQMLEDDSGSRYTWLPASELKKPQRESKRL